MKNIRHKLVIIPIIPLILTLMPVSSLAAGVINASGSVVLPAASAYPDWDVNCDGICNIGDITAIGMHIGETGIPGWIRSDVNKDGVVDQKDIDIVKSHLGESSNPNTPTSITTTSLSSGTVGTAYSQTLTASGGSGTYSWSIFSGSLPGRTYFK